MDIKKEMLDLISDARWSILECGEMHEYADMPEKKRKNLLNIDPYFNYEEFVAMYDTTITENAKQGIVFTTNGVYIEGASFFEQYYVNYADIISTSFTAGFLEDFIIETSTSGKLECATAHFVKGTGCSALSDLLTQLTALALKNNNGRSDRATGKVDKKLKFTQDETIIANLIIHPASAAAGAVGAGLAQIPLSDSLVIAPIQIGMIVGLGAAFGISVTEGAAKGILTGAAASFVGRGLSQILVGWIPVAGNIINASTAVALTQSIGWIAVRRFKVVQSGGFFEGMKVGTVQAARQFEEKYRRQANEFIRKGKVFESEKDEWLKLIGNYMRLIGECVNLGDAHELANDLQKELEKLQALKVVRD